MYRENVVITANNSLNYEPRCFRCITGLLQCKSTQAVCSEPQVWGCHMVHTAETPQNQSTFELILAIAYAQIICSWQNFATATFSSIIPYGGGILMLRNWYTIIRRVAEQKAQSPCCYCRGSEHCSQHHNQAAHTCESSPRGSNSLFWTP